MTQEVYPVPAPLVKTAWLNADKYHTLYQQSISDPEAFWGEQARTAITWMEEWDRVLSGGFDLLDVKWFEGAALNASVNCLDRHLETRSKRTAIIWEGDNPADKRVITYGELHEQVCRFANVLLELGIQKGDRVCIYLPMIPEAVIAMLACARIGAVHSVVFGGFSAESLRTRIQDAECKLLVTANEGLRGTKRIPLKQNVDTALQASPQVSQVIVIKRTETEVTWVPERDVWYHEAMQGVNSHCPPARMVALDPLFILYTSGSTGKPKGILHATAGYLVYAAVTFKLVFDYHETDIYWCTADVGWITGHTYNVYGPLLNAATIVLYEGVPHYPSPSRFWEIIDRYHVSLFYTAPTAIRALRREGDAYVTQTKRTSLRLLGTVGEPINPDAWEWYFNVVGNQHCPIVDTWWQTETGGIMITPLPGATPLKPGSAAWPFLGVEAAIVDDKGKPVPPGTMGNLVITKPWPGMMQTVYRDHDRFVKNYFGEIPGVYLTGDLAICDEEGYFWISGRSDDVIKVSGHRIGTQEVESALIHHPSVSEAAVVARDDAIKGQSIVAFVTLKTGVKEDDTLKQALVKTVRQVIGPIATPDVILFTPGLPKTRSGKIMRRILRKIANGATTDLGDLSTLAEPEVVDQLVKDYALIRETE